MSAVMGKGYDFNLTVEVLTVVRELQGGDWTAFPVADPTRVSFGTEVSCLEDQRLLLSEYLAELPARELSRFSLPQDVELEQATLECRPVARQAAEHIVDRPGRL